MRKLKAFSLIELMISLIVISCITAAFSPVISRKLSTSLTTISHSGNNNLNNNLCPLGQYLDDKTNTCINCSDTFQNCIVCTKTACSNCESDYTLINGHCEIENCPPKTIEIIIGNKRLCATQYNMGDADEFPINVLGVKTIYPPKTDEDDNYCWKGMNSDCRSNEDSYSGCARTVCNYYAAEILCNSLNYNNTSWRLPTRFELANFNPAMYSNGLNKDGLMLCDGDYDCNGSRYGTDGIYYNPYHLWSSTSSDSDYIYTYRRYTDNLGSTSDWNTSSLHKTSNASVRCVRTINELTCKDRFGAGCVECNNTECTRCTNIYNLTNGHCSKLPVCPDKTIKITVNNKDLCVTQYNIGDNDLFKIDTSKINLISIGTNYTNNNCCWGTGWTSENCGGSTDYTYSPCRRTICTHYAAENVCKNLNYLNSDFSWRLPTVEELAVFNTYSKDKGDKGLTLCGNQQYTSTYWCTYSNECKGSSDGNCYPAYVWSGTLYDDNNAYSYYLNNDSWYSYHSTRKDAFSVRCVAEL